MGFNANLGLGLCIMNLLLKLASLTCIVMVYKLLKSSFFFGLYVMVIWVLECLKTNNSDI